MAILTKGKNKTVYRHAWITFLQSNYISFQDFLQKYGYIKKKGREEITPEELRKGILDYQEFMNLEKTGMLLRCSLD